MCWPAARAAMVGVVTWPLAGRVTCTGGLLSTVKVTVPVGCKAPLWVPPGGTADTTAEAVQGLGRRLGLGGLLVFLGGGGGRDVKFPHAVDRRGETGHATAVEADGARRGAVDAEGH